jgi:endonuclease YncB( thermonuclease family)
MSVMRRYTPWLPLVLLFVAAAGPTTGLVKSVHDGDTFTLDNGDKVRLKWANTPEIAPEKEPYSVDAKEFTERMVLDQQVTLNVDPTAERDGYGRLLADVSTPSGDLSLGLIANGLAHLYIIPPQDGDPQPFVDAQNDAKTKHLGIWSTDRYQGSLHITSFHANGIGDESKDPNLEYLRVCNVSAGALDIGGFRVQNIAGDTFTLPSMTVPVGNTVMLLSGKGPDQTNPERQLTAHFNSDVPVWNNSRDRVTLLDKDSVVQDVRDYMPATHE